LKRQTELQDQVSTFASHQITSQPPKIYHQKTKNRFLNVKFSIIF